MLAVQDLFDAILLGCFLFGFIFSLLLLVLGDVGIHHSWGHGHGHGDAEGFVPINLSTVLAFVTWFGGVGYLARNAGGFAAPLSVLIGLTGGLLGGSVVAWVLSRLLGSRDGILNPEDYRLPGTIGRVSSSIRANGTGEVMYEQFGVRQVSAARSVGNAAIPRGAEVVVLDSKEGIALVELSALFFGDDASLPRPGTLVDHPLPARSEPR
jgi:hypothetical protein